MSLGSEQGIIWMAVEVEIRSTTQPPARRKFRTVRAADENIII